LSGISGIKLALYNDQERGNFQYIILEVDGQESGIRRDQLMKILHAENVRARRYFYPGCHRMEPYRSFFPNAGLLLPETEKLCSRVLCLPTGTAVHLQDIARICQIIRLAVDESQAIQQRLLR
jgi:dTDP-4-amino-4,6-dideoxygalactose transaminase